MSNDPTIQNVLEAVQGLATHMDEQFADVRAEMRSDFAYVRSEMKTGFVDVRKEMTSGFADVRSETALGFADVRSEMATKKDLALLRYEMKYDLQEVRQEMATKQDLKDMKQDIFTEIDRFVVLHQTLDIELIALNSRCGRMETFMVKVADRLDLDFLPT